MRAKIMSEDKKLDFSLPERAPAAAVRSGAATWLVVVLLLLVGANLYLSWNARSGAGEPVRTNERLPADKLKKLALKLEKQGLSGAAAATWLEYLNTAEDVLAAGKGPGSEKLDGFLENTAIFQLLLEAL